MYSLTHTCTHTFWQTSTCCSTLGKVSERQHLIEAIDIPDSSWISECTGWISLSKWSFVKACGRSTCRCWILIWASLIQWIITWITMNGHTCRGCRKVLLQQGDHIKILHLCIDTYPNSIFDTIHLVDSCILSSPTIDLYTEQSSSLPSPGKTCFIQWIL